MYQPQNNISVNQDINLEMSNRAFDVNFDVLK